MKFLILGDLHIGARNGNSNFLKMMDSFFHDELFPFILKNKIDHVIQLGDILDKRKGIDFTISKYLMDDFFSWFEFNRVYLYSLTGNHDMYYRQSLGVDGPSQFAEKFKYVKIIKKPLVDKRIVYIPWVCDENKEAVEKFLKENKSPDKIVVGHFELAGFPIQKGFYADKGTLELKHLKGYHKVLSGHYHSPSEKGNIIYVGTPYELTWSDYGDNKRFFVYDNESKTLEEHPTKIKLYHKIFYQDGIVVDKEQYRASYVSVVIEQDYDEKKLEKFLKELDTVEPISVIVTDKRNRQQELTEEEISSADITNPMHIMLSQVDSVVENEELRSLVKSLTAEIYQKAQEAMR